MKYFFMLLAIGSLIVFNLTHSKPKREKDNNAILFANPLLFKALSATGHNLLADALWLLSNSVSEMSGRSTEDVDLKELTDASRTIAFMDPYFQDANNYATMFIVGYGRDLKTALELVRLERFSDHNNFRLYFDELIFMVTYAIDYGMQVDYKQLIALAKQAAQLPEGKRVLGRIKIESWLDDILVAANNRLNRQQQALDDLLWLKKQTKKKSRILEIEKRIKALKKEMQGLKN